MEFASAKKAITPAFSFVQQGFAARHDPWTAVHDDIYATVAVIKENETVILISLDLLSGDRDFEREVYAEIRARYGVADDYIILSYSHTHGALGLGSYGGEDKKAYRDTVRETVLELTGICMENMAECRASVCKAESDFGVSRRYPSPEGILWRPNNDPEAADRDLYILKFEDEHGIRALVWSYACHPTSCGPSNLEITADYPGAVRAALEEKYGCSVIFLQGCGADVKPKISAAGDRFISMSAAEMTEGAAQMTRDIISAVEGNEWRKAGPGITARSAGITLPCRRYSRADWERIAYGSGEPEYRRAAAVKAIEKFDRGELTDGLPFNIKCVALGGVRFVCLENETVNAYGKKIKERVSGDTITLGYTGRICCYIPTVQVLREGGYECETFLSSGAAGPFAEETEELIVGTAVKIS